MEPGFDTQLVIGEIAGFVVLLAGFVVAAFA